MDLYSLFQTMIIAIFSGLGTAVGSYFAQKPLKRIDKFSSKLRRKRHGISKK